MIDTVTVNEPYNLFNNGVFTSKAGNYFLMFAQSVRTGQLNTTSIYSGRVHPSSENTFNLTAVLEGTSAQAPRISSNGDLTINSDTSATLGVGLLIFSYT